MRKIDTQEIADKVYSLALKAGISLTPDCKAALKSAADAETSGAAKFALDTLILNSQTAEAEGLPVCQDTGMAVVLLEIGQEVFLTGELLEDAVNGAVRRAYADGYFRKSVCDPITRQNTGDNTPAVIHTHICAGEQVKITFLYVGVGIGGTFDTCAFLAKKALTREVGAHSQRAEIAEIEKTALERINALGIGCQGFHGDTTAIGVSCEWAPTHIAGLPVAVNIQCHCVRCGKAVI